MGTYHKRNDALREQRIDQVRVELDAFLGHRVVPPAQRDNPRPRKREAVGLDAVRRQELEVLFPELVRVGCHITVATVQGLAGLLGIVVPDGPSATAGVRRAFDLEARCTEIESVQHRTQHNTSSTQSQGHGRLGGHMMVYTDLLRSPTRSRPVIWMQGKYVQSF